MAKLDLIFRLLPCKSNMQLSSLAAKYKSASYVCVQLLCIPACLIAAKGAEICICQGFIECDLIAGGTLLNRHPMVFTLYGEECSATLSQMSAPDRLQVEHCLDVALASALNLPEYMVNLKIGCILAYLSGSDIPVVKHQLVVATIAEWASEAFPKNSGADRAAG